MIRAKPVTSGRRFPRRSARPMAPPLCPPRNDARHAAGGPTQAEIDSVTYCPPPEEIARAAAEIRAGWSEETEAARRFGLDTEEWHVPEVPSPKQI